MSKKEYKEYFEQNNFKGNNYETAKFIKFLMEKKSRGKEIEEFTGIKHSQITSYKKIINSGKMEDLKSQSISKVFKSIETTKASRGPKLDNGVICEFERLSDEIPDKFMLGEDDDEFYDSDDDERLAWEEEVRRITLGKSNGFTDDAEYFLTELVDENMRLRRRTTKYGETIEELRKENASLLAYKKFFEDMKLKQRELEASFPVF